MNTWSAFGRMSYGAHMVSTVLVIGSAGFLYKARAAASAAAQALEDQENLPKLKKVDPDLFQPFSPIPFHNNMEHKYRYANMKMHGYLDAKTQLNLKDYPYKGFHDCYDHSNKKKHYYDWVSVVPSDPIPATKA